MVLFNEELQREYVLVCVCVRRTEGHGPFFLFFPFSVLTTAARVRVITRWYAYSAHGPGGIYIIISFLRARARLYERWLEGPCTAISRDVSLLPFIFCTFRLSRILNVLKALVESDGGEGGNVLYFPSTSFFYDGFVSVCPV